jgi:hypothetical protein
MFIIQPTKTLQTIIRSPEAQVLLAAGLKFVSTDRQLANGTIALTGKVKNRPVSYKVTASGAVYSNGFIARDVYESSDAQQYRAGLKAAGELFAKRLAA